MQPMLVQIVLNHFILQQIKQSISNSTFLNKILSQDMNQIKQKKFLIYQFLKIKIIIKSLMKLIIEENRIVESLSIFLYSRKYEKLFCEINDIQTHQSIIKSQLSTCKNVEIHLGRTLSKVKIGLKLNQNSTSILNYCKIGHANSDEESVIQKRSNYLKVKTKFKQYSLLFQIYYSNCPNEEEIRNRKQQAILKQRASKIEYQQLALQQNMNVIKIHLNNLQNQALNRAFYSKREVSISSEEQLQKQLNTNTEININKNLKSQRSRIAYRTREIKSNTNTLNQLIRINTKINTKKPNQLKQVGQNSITDWRKKPLSKKQKILRNQKQILFLDQQTKLEIAKRSMKNIVLQVKQSQRKINFYSKRKNPKEKLLIKKKNQKNLQDIMNQLSINKFGYTHNVINKQNANNNTQNVRDKKSINEKTSQEKSKQNKNKNKLNKLFLIKNQKIKVNQKQNQEFLQDFYQDSLNQIQQQGNLLKYVKDYCQTKLSNN